MALERRQPSPVKSPPQKIRTKKSVVSDQIQLQTEFNQPRKTLVPNQLQVPDFQEDHKFLESLLIEGQKQPSEEDPTEKPIFQNQDLNNFLR